MPYIKDKVILFFATGGLIGYSPVGPGTFGSLVAIPLCWLLSLLGVQTALLCIGCLIVLSIYFSHVAEQIEKENDPKQIVVDEICGMTVTLFSLPFTPIIVICGFALFRLFDISKPFPIRLLEKKLPGGIGIVADDLLAGLIAHLILRFGINLHIIG